MLEGSGFHKRLEVGVFSQNVGGQWFSQKAGGGDVFTKCWRVVVFTKGWRWGCFHKRLEGGVSQNAGGQGFSQKAGEWLLSYRSIRNKFTGSCPRFCPLLGIRRVHFQTYSFIQLFMEKKESYPPGVQNLPG